jgi:hypothetical protein
MPGTNQINFISTISPVPLGNDNKRAIATQPGNKTRPSLAKLFVSATHEF